MKLINYWKKSAFDIVKRQEKIENVFYDETNLIKETNSMSFMDGFNGDRMNGLDLDEK